MCLCFISPCALSPHRTTHGRAQERKPQFFPGFPSCSQSLPCEQPPLSGSAAWGTAVLPGELQTHGCPPSFLLHHPSKAWHSFLRSAWILCLGLVPAAHHTRCVWLQDWNIATAIHAGRSFPCTGQSGICGVGGPPSHAGCLYISKGGSHPNGLSWAGL